MRMRAIGTVVTGRHDSSLSMFNKKCSIWRKRFHLVQVADQPRPVLKDYNESKEREACLAEKVTEQENTQKQERLTRRVIPNMSLSIPEHVVQLFFMVVKTAAADGFR